MSRGLNGVHIKRDSNWRREAHQRGARAARDKLLRRPVEALKAYARAAN